jgi:ferredoxin
MKKSTREFIREAGKTKNYSFWDMLHGYVYMRWPYQYISIGKGDHPFSKLIGRIAGFLSRLLPKKEPVPGDRGFAEGYHGKAIPLETAKALVSIQKEIKLDHLEQVIPFERARDIILKNPDHIAVIDCPCRKGMEHPCEPLDVCMIIGEPFTSFVLDHHPDTSRLITSGEARQILEDENRRGHVSHAYFKDAALNRFYAICNCCSCCCGAMKAQRNGIPMVISSGYISQVDESACVLCAACVDSCQFGALAMNEKLEIDLNLCMGCGVCVNHCPSGALSLVLDPSKPAALEIEMLTA